MRLVPCDGCTACCRGPGRRPLRLKRFEEHEFKTMAIDGVRYVRQSVDGTCVYSTPNGCAVYERRPSACRTFDCRDYAEHYLPHVATAARMIA